MTQPDFSGTFEGRFVDDDNLRESGRVWIEVDNGMGEMSAPIDPESINAALAEISASGDDAVQAVGVAKDGAVGAVNTAKTGALTDIGVEVTKAEDAADRAEAGATSAEADATQTGLDRQAAAQSATNAATSAGEAAIHEDTSLDAAAAAIAAAVSVAQFQGHGFPEGVVAAPVGSIYTDLDATNGAIRWIKASGTGNTGWAVEYGDTGWRDISADLLSGESAGWNAIRRIGNVVYMTIQLSSVELPAIGVLYRFPQGFHSRAGGAFRSFAFDMTGLTWLIRPGYLSNQTPKNGQTWMTLSFPTNDSWPTTLPGIPAKL